jgi:hypothetical protein
VCYRLEPENYRYDLVMVEVDDVTRVLEMIRAPTEEGAARFSTSRSRCDFRDHKGGERDRRRDAR